MDNKELCALAKKARESARAEITGFKVGAALLCKNGDVYLGCNIEDPSGIGITNICAERCAIIKALSDIQGGSAPPGAEKLPQEQGFQKIAIVGGKENLTFCTPCGACRQYLQSWNPDITVVISDGENPPRELHLSELLPYSFERR